MVAGRDITRRSFPGWPPTIGGVLATAVPHGGHAAQGTITVLNARHMLGATPRRSVLRSSHWHGRPLPPDASLNVTLKC